MITAIVLAAGLSTRMGRLKPILPWGSTTVIGRVVTTLIEAGLDQVLVVTGAGRIDVEAEISRHGWINVQAVFNPQYAEDDMLISLRTGMAGLSADVTAILVVLGDQPQMETGVVRALLEAYRNHRHLLIIPSYNMRRGHPWLVDRSLWAALQSLPKGATMRDFLHANAKHIAYIQVTTPSILSDLDTPEDYARGLAASQDDRK